MSADAPHFSSPGQPESTAARGPWHVAIVGAGPAGLSLALLAAQAWPQARITVLDARPAELDLGRDGRTLALSLGTVHSLQQIGVWAAVAAHSAPILEVHVSQQQPTLGWPGTAQPQVRIHHRELGEAQLGAVVSYGALVQPLQQRWQSLTDSQPRLATSWGTRVLGMDAGPDGVSLRTTTAGGGENTHATMTVDLAVVAEGGVFADQPKLQWPQGVSRDYGQSAWVGQVALAADAPRGVAFERFTPSGPLALLPLPDAPLGAPHGSGPSVSRAALVWCVQQGDDPVAPLDDAQRLTLLNSLFHERVGTLQGITPLKCFPLGLNAHHRLVEHDAIVRIGNAAQTLHPVAGQGFNLGMRDVQVLLQSVQDAGVDRLAHSGQWDEARRLQAAALRRFERKRQPDRLLLTGATDFLARSFTWPAPALATVRGWGLGAMQALPMVRQGLARAMMFGRR